MAQCGSKSIPRKQEAKEVIQYLEVKRLFSLRNYFTTKLFACIESALTGKEQETLFTSLPFPLSFLSLTLPILPCFSSPSPGSGRKIWLKGPQPELRIGD